MPAVAARTTVAPWSDHNGALKYFRDQFPLAEDHMLTTGEWVKKVVHGVRQDYTFGEWVQWDWRTMVAAFNEQDRHAIIGPGITAVAVSRRAGSYDHHLAVATRECNWAKQCEEIVDFSFTRADGTVVLVHPKWKKKSKNVQWCVRPPHGTPTAIIPDNGPGRSDGPGTYRRIVSAAYTDSAFTTAVAGPGTPAVAEPGTPLVAGPGTPAVAGPGTPLVAAAVIAKAAVVAVGHPPPPPPPVGTAVAAAVVAVGHPPPPPPPQPPPPALRSMVMQVNDTALVAADMQVTDTDVLEPLRRQYMANFLDTID